MILRTGITLLSPPLYSVIGFTAVDQLRFAGLESGLIQQQRQQQHIEQANTTIK